MLFAFSKAFFLALCTTTATRAFGASFEKDVVGAANAIRSLDNHATTMELDNMLSSSILKKKMADPSSDLHQELLAKALPVREFESKYGVDLQREDSRHLQEDDDFGMSGYDMISFSGYSLKFAKCQPVQYFSERALQMGEHSPMITNDIVVLRLCPTNTCSSTSGYGCQYNFSEYAIALAEYIRIMLYYAAAKRDYMCDYCYTCLGNNNRVRRKSRRLEDANAGEEDGEGDDQGEQQQEEEGGEEDNANEQAQNNAYQQSNDDDSNNDDGDDYVDYAANACSTWSTYCSDFSTYCVEDDDEDEKMDFEDYLGYLYCSQIDYNNYAYFVKPRCDGYQGTIKMGIFYDKYCNQYAGNEVSLKNVGMGFRESAFSSFYSSSCLDCSESDYPPYDASSTLCNRLHYSSAKCTEDMTYALFGGNQVDDATECSFIESIRFGTYNELGQLTTRDASGAVAQEITEPQKIILCIAVALCVALVIYACYLHHAMTNLLIKSLSHHELLPPSRHQSRQRNSSSPDRPRRSGRRLKKVDGSEPDWDDDENGGEYA
ncbi:hypothetical protein ACA910_016882 [Epithemia clementina (nom. ined.)]